MTRYSLFEVDWNIPNLPTQKEITAEEFETLIRQHVAPDKVERILQMSKITNGQYFLMPKDSKVDKRVFYQQVPK